MPPSKRRGPAKPSASPADTSMPVDTPFPMTARERSSAVGRANLAKFREAKAAKQAGARARREDGEPSPLERYRAGTYPITEWSEAELSHGQPANRDGGFDGASPKFTAREHAAIRAQLLRHGEKLLASWYPGALKVLEEVARTGESEPSRVKAANLMIERIAGRTIEKIELKSADPWADILEEVLEDEVLERVQDTEDA